jgi:glucosylceramidase
MSLLNLSSILGASVRQPALFAALVVALACAVGCGGGSRTSGSSGGTSAGVGGSGASGFGGMGGAVGVGGRAGNESVTVASGAGGVAGIPADSAGSGGSHGGMVAASGDGGKADAGIAGSGARGGAPAAGSGGMSTGSAGVGVQAGAGPGGTSSRSELPPFVTSGPNDYWNTQGHVTATAGMSAELTVDVNTKHQVFTGFGGCFNEMGWDALSVLSATDVTTALTLLFDPHEGANFRYGRLPIGASDYAMSWYTLDDTAGDYSMADFSIDRDRQKLIPFIKAALEIRPDIRLWASPWIPPDWMKDSGGNMKSDAQTQTAYALYLAKFVEEYAKEGLAITAIHPQNEPGYASVKWTETEFIDFFKTYLGPTFSERQVPAEIWCGTMSAPADGTWATDLANDAAAMQYVKGFGLQWNLQSTVATLAPKGPVWQTEHKCGNYNFATPYWDQSRYDPNKPQNDHAYGEESWQLIRDWIVAGVNAYSAWNMVLDTVGKSLGNWPQNALLVVDRSAEKLIVTPAYYAFRHFSQYVAAGATRVEVSGTTDALAFENPDGSIVAEVYNQGSSVKTTSVAALGTSYQFDVPAHGWATLLVQP